MADFIRPVLGQIEIGSQDPESVLLESGRSRCRRQLDPLSHQLNPDFLPTAQLER